MSKIWCGRLWRAGSLTVTVQTPCLPPGQKGNLCERSLTSCVSLFILLPCAALAVYYLLLQTFVLRLEFLLNAVLLCFYALEFLLGLLSISAFARWRVLMWPFRLVKPSIISWHTELHSLRLCVQVQNVLRSQHRSPEPQQDGSAVSSARCAVYYICFLPSDEAVFVNKLWFIHCYQFISSVSF